MKKVLATEGGTNTRYYRVLFRRLDFEILITGAVVLLVLTLFVIY